MYFRWHWQAGSVAEGGVGWREGWGGGRGGVEGGVEGGVGWREGWGGGRGGVEGGVGDFCNHLRLCAAKYWELLESASAVSGVVVKPQRFTCSIYGKALGAILFCGKFVTSMLWEEKV